MSMHELGSTSADRLRSAGLSSYENSSRPTTTTERQTTTRRTETINPPGEAVNFKYHLEEEEELPSCFFILPSLIDVAPC
jgi:hypothetical protein